jgi:hypothetical protein
VNLEDVAGELAAALATIEGLHVVEWGVERIPALPAAVIALPERLDYDATYGRGSDRIPDQTVLVLKDRPATPEARRVIAEFAVGSGPKSVKAVIEGYTYAACDTPRVVWVEFDAVSYAGVEYLAAMFHLDIAGRGA